MCLEGYRDGCWICLQRHQDAWQVIYNRYFDGLVKWIRRRLGRKQATGLKPHEVATKVFGSLVEKPSLLEKFDSQKGGLGSYLNLLADEELKREARRRQRWDHQQLTDEMLARVIHEVPLEEILKELLPRLSETEARYLTTHLLRQPNEQERAEFSQQNAYQVKKRILKKWKKFRRES